MTDNHDELVGMTVSEVRQTPPDEAGRSHFIVLLTETDGDRRLPIWIGKLEAAALAYKLENTQLPRPLTHELLVAAVEALDGTIREVRIREIVDGTYYATMILDAPKGNPIEIDARPSDALNVALLTAAEISATHTVLDAQEEDNLAKALDAEPVTARQIFKQMYPRQQQPEE